MIPAGLTSCNRYVTYVITAEPVSVPAPIASTKTRAVLEGIRQQRCATDRHRSVHRQGRRVVVAPHVDVGLLVA
jgi:hypothetical protein